MTREPGRADLRNIGCEAIGRRSLFTGAALFEAVAHVHVVRSAAARRGWKVRIAEWMVLHVDDCADAVGPGEITHRPGDGRAARGSSGLGEEDQRHFRSRRCDRYEEV